MEDFCQLCKRGKYEEVKDLVLNSARAANYRCLLFKVSDENHYPFCHALTSGNVELARFLWKQIPLAHRLDMSHLFVHFVELLTTEKTMDMFHFLVEICPEIASMTCSSAYQEIYYVFLATYNSVELVRTLIERDEVALCKGKYHEEFQDYIGGIIHGKIYGKTVSRTNLSEKMCLVVYCEMERQHMLDSFIELVLGIYISERALVDALIQKQIPPPKRYSNLGKMGDNILHFLILRGKYVFASWIVDHTPSYIHDMNYEIQSPLYYLLQSMLLILRKDPATWNEKDNVKVNLAKRMIRHGACTKGYPTCVQAYTASYKRIIYTYWGVKDRFPNELTRMLLTYMDPL